MREQDDAAPAHHARRPMNAFLIFCKRHRGVVRDKYPNLENRSITKILGEWWANLDKEDKACYTGLAKQYKDAFFNANPDFKWYKLPAPPLRAGGARREPPPAPAAPAADPANNNSTKQNLNTPPPAAAFTPGKLADEAHMGGLSSLLATKTDEKSNPQLAGTFPFASHVQSHLRDLQNALSETTRMFEDLEEPARDQLTHQHVIDQVVDTRYSRDDGYGYQRQWSDDEKNSKSKRSCKGKKYQEFMAVGGFIVNKRQKREFSDKFPDEEYTPSCSWNSGGAPPPPPPSELGPPAPSSPALPPPSPLPASHCDREVLVSDAVDSELNANKAFQASDFDLDAKIRALPSLSLEKFQQRKRENKRKKKTINLKPKCEEPRYISFGRDAAIGSQKRKPRKISITRLEINSLISAVEVARDDEAAAARAQAAGAGAGAGVGGGAGPGAADLLALATLAEVAASTSKIDGTAIL